MGFMSHILPVPVSLRKNYLPHAVSNVAYSKFMPHRDTKAVLWRNVTALMVHHWGKENLSQLSRTAKIGLASCTRMKEQKTSVGLDILDAVAGAFGLQAWHLLTPELDPSNPPVIWLTESERKLYATISTAVSKLEKIQH